MNQFETRSGASPGQRLALLGALLTGMLAAMFAMGVPASQAAIPLAPAITASPSNPNTTHGTVTFSYGKDPSDPESINRFQCRRFETATPPAPTAGWSNCSNTNAQTGSVSYAGMANVSQTFQVKARATTPTTFGPETSFVWTQNVPDPALAPAITQKPDQTHTTSTKVSFAFKGGAGEENIPAGFDCRLDGSGADPWAACNGGTFSATPGNGPHTFEVRAKGGSGAISPVTTVEWTNAFPNPGTSVGLEDQFRSRIIGGEPNSQLGPAQLGGAAGMSNAGDVNGDGKDDLMVLSDFSRNGTVIFGGDRRNDAGINDLPPTQAIRIVSTADDSAFIGIGDQNGDGRDDFLVATGYPTEVYVLYTPSDFGALPPCNPGGALRCLNLADFTPSQGYRITASASPWDNALGGAFSAGHFDNDGIEDFGFSMGPNLIVIKGEARTADLDLSTADATNSITYAGATMNGPYPIGDLNGDGRDEIAGMGEPLGSGGMTVAFGREFSADNERPIATNPIDFADGFPVAAPPFQFTGITPLGDVNGDGRNDIAVGEVSIAGLLSGDPMNGQVSIRYMPPLPLEGPLLIGFDMEPNEGYVVDGAGTEAGFGFSVTAGGDLNGDGIEDLLVGGPLTVRDGTLGAGAIYALFTHSTAPADPISAGAGLAPEDGVAIMNSRIPSGGNLDFAFGMGVVALGDVDGDGVPDFAAPDSAASFNGVSKSGVVYQFSGADIMARADTGGASAITDKSAMLSGSASGGRGQLDTKFEYGKSDSYGSQTESQQAGDPSSQSVGAALTGLEANTTYHYRLVVTNERGLTRYGTDRTFTTATKPPPEGCAADSTLPGCPDYDYCKANPGKAECQAPVAKLSNLIVSVGASKVKRGKKTAAKVAIVNTGTAAAAGVKVCMTAPKKLIGGAKCVNVGSLGAGATKTVRFNVTVKRTAKKGKVARLSFRATANGLGAKAGKANIRIG